MGGCHTDIKTNLSSKLDWYWTCQLELSLAILRKILLQNIADRFGKDSKILCKILLKNVSDGFGTQQIFGNMVLQSIPDKSVPIQLIIL